MQRPIAVALTTSLLAAAMTAAVSAQSPPPYPEDAGLDFVPVGDSAWRAIEPDLDCDRAPFWWGADTAIAPDGRVWFSHPSLGIRQLGACPLSVEGYPPSNFIPRDQALAPDGTLWVLDADRLMSWDGSDWIIHVEGAFNVGGCNGRVCYHTLDIAPDGSIWLSAGTKLGVFDEGTWTEYEEDWMNGPLLVFGPDGAVWVAGHDGPVVFYP